MLPSAPKTFACEFLGSENLVIEKPHWISGNKDTAPFVLKNAWAEIPGVFASSAVGTSGHWIVVDMEDTYAVKTVVLQGGPQPILDMMDSLIMFGLRLPSMSPTKPGLAQFVAEGFTFCTKIVNDVYSDYASYKVIGVGCGECYVVGQYLLIYNEHWIQLAGLGVYGFHHQV